MNSFQRISAISIKEWQLNLRFAMQFFINNLVGPVKTAILLMLLYAGLLKTTDTPIGTLSAKNFHVYVLLGTICHSLFSSGCSLFIQKFSQEKWWQTLMATLISPATPVEVNVGFVAGSGLLHFITASSFLFAVTIFAHANFACFFAGLGVLFVLCLYAFGLSLIGGTLILCFEGRSFFFDYGVQALIFLSCFYYPPEILPHKIRMVASVLPTFQLGSLMKQAYLSGITLNWVLHLTGLAVGGCLTFLIPSLFYQWAIKRFGIVGY